MLSQMQSSIVHKDSADRRIPVLTRGASRAALRGLTALALTFQRRTAFCMLPDAPKSPKPLRQRLSPEQKSCDAALH